LEALRGDSLLEDIGQIKLMQEGLKDTADKKVAEITDTVALVI
jgi:hypothetical protein